MDDSEHDLVDDGDCDDDHMDVDYDLMDHRDMDDCSGSGSGVMEMAEVVG